MEAYHYSKKKFDQFEIDQVGSNVDDGQWGRGFYFFSDYAEAEYCARQFGKYVYEVELDINNPLIIDFDNMTPEEIIKTMGLDAEKEAEYIEMLKYFNAEGDLDSTVYFEGAGIEKTLQAKGYDAIIISNHNGSDFIGEEICVFDASKIKIIELEEV